MHERRDDGAPDVQEAVAKLGEIPGCLLIDGNKSPRLPVRQFPIIDGDALCISISAASIVAKVARDAMMRAWDEQLPGYGFAMHKGYATAAHRAALGRLGPSTLHRLTWAPVRAAALVASARGQDTGSR